MVYLINCIGFLNVHAKKVCSILPPRKKLLVQEIVKNLFVSAHLWSVRNFFDIQELKVESTANLRSSTTSSHLFLDIILFFTAPFARTFSTGLEIFHDFFCFGATVESGSYRFFYKWKTEKMSFQPANSLNFYFHDIIWAVKLVVNCEEWVPYKFLVSCKLIDI